MRSSSGKENDSRHNAPVRISPRTKRLAPSNSNSSTSSTSSSSSSSADAVARFLQDILDRADKPPRMRILTTQADRLLRALAAAVHLRAPHLLRLAASAVSRLSAEPDSASAVANPRYLLVLEAALACDAASLPRHQRNAIQDAWRVSARAVRNLAAFAEANALVVARETAIVKLIVKRVLSGVHTPSDEAACAYVLECVAALANLIRHGAQYQGYVHKHHGLNAIANVAEIMEDPHCVFHACRALAEFSLNPKWLMALLDEKCIPTCLEIIDSAEDPEIAAEATRCIGNMAATKVGREAVIRENGVERIARRVTLLGVSVQGTLVRDYTFGAKDHHLAVDLFRAMSNLCVGSKEASRRLIECGGVMPLISACDETTTGSKAVKTEAFRGLLIVAQAGPSFRATVLREIGIRIRHDTILGRSTAHLYDLGRRIKVEASTEHKDDIPQTIAGLGSASKNFLLGSGPFAKRDRSNVANSVPGLQSPANVGFRQSGRVLSVQRHIPHRARLEMERKQRSRPSAAITSSNSSNGNSSVRRGSSELRSARSASSEHHSSPSRRRSSPSGSKVTSESMSEIIPRCTFVSESQSNDSGSAGNLVMAAWQAVMSAMSGTSPSVSQSNSHSVSHSAVSSATHISSSHSPTDEDDSEEPDTFDEPIQDVYEIGMPLGRGGFATVFLAKNLRTGELVAVKRFHPPASTTPDAIRKAELAARRAVKEQRIWDGLSHKNIVSYRGCFFGENGELNLVAEYIPGWSLADHLSQITKFPEHMVARIARQIVDGLDYLHKCGVTHRDVKPANILVDPSGLIKVTDFGVSSAVDVPTMTGNSLVGTPWYIAPEMIEGRPYGKSVDVWSLGCTVLELATGRRPYHNLRAHAAMFRMTQDRYPPIPKKLSPKLRDFLKTCWVWNPEERPTPAHLKRHPFLQNIADPALSDLANKERAI